MNDSNSLRRTPIQIVFAAVLAAGFIGHGAEAEDRVLHTFDRKQLTDVYFSEGANAGDLNRDGHADVVYGPYWFAGPDFADKHEIYPPKPQPREGYADNFFSWIYDFNRDGWNDVFVVGFPGTPAFVYENPKEEKPTSHWKKHQVFDSVENESPHFTNLIGDERPELVCTHDGFFGFATIDWEKPFEAWKYHAISDRIAPKRFGHGLGVGDVNGDGRLDIIQVAGWFEQPSEKALRERWEFHPHKFSGAYGGAEMYAYDVDGDGDNDIITSLAAHDFGLAWFEQERVGDKVTFRQHLIMGDRPEQNRYGVVFSEPHSVNLVDIDGDGLKDIITGKTYYSHHKQSPMWDAGAVVYWFKLARGDKGVNWTPYEADGEAGIGRQLIVTDLDGDKLPDIVVGGMKGAHVLRHRKQTVDEAAWREAQPKEVSAPAAKTSRGTAAPINEKTGQVEDALEGETLMVVKKSAGQTSAQEMKGFAAGRWSDNKQLFWTGAKPGDRLELELPIDKGGKFEMRAALTMARDYGIVQFHLDDKPLGEPLDLYNFPDVITTGELTLGERELSAGKHRLSIEITGSNPSAVKAYMVGLDYVRVVPQ